MTIRRQFICFCLLFATSDALAYIPKAQTILGRVARTHGKGAFQIEQDVVFRTGTESLVLREKWIVESGDSLRVSVSLPQGEKSAAPVHLEAVYRGGKKTMTDPAGGPIKTVAISSEFIEGFFHDRTGRALAAHLVRAKIVPNGFAADAPKIQKIDQIKHTPEPGVRLGRLAGVVTWVFGEPSPETGPLMPQAWIEQDAFWLRKLRFPSQAELTADRYSTFAGALKFPRERSLSWAEGTVNIRLVSAKALPPGQTAKWLDPNSVKASAGRLPDVAVVREFYSRFR